MLTRSLLAALVATCAAAPAAARQVYYDIDFSRPIHIPGHPPAITTGDPPRRGPTANNFYAPYVVESFGPLTNGVLRFAAPGSWLSQIELAIAKPVNGVGLITPSYGVDFDLVIDRLDGSFAMFFDSPKANQFRFNAGEVRLGPSQTEVIGTYADDRLLRVSIDFFLITDSWNIRLNGRTLHSGETAFDARLLQTIRLSLDEPYGGRSEVYVDNIRVRAIPAPGGALLLLAPACLRRRRPR